jgi:hypothetical protein
VSEKSAPEWTIRGPKKRPPDLSAGVSHHAKNTSKNLLNLQIGPTA